LLSSCSSEAGRDQTTEFWGRNTDWDAFFLLARIDKSFRTEKERKQREVAWYLHENMSCWTGNRRQSEQGRLKVWSGWTVGRRPEVVARDLFL
jgi:hypothetical protein